MTKNLYQKHEDLEKFHRKMTSLILSEDTDNTTREKALSALAHIDGRLSELSKQISQERTDSERELAEDFSPKDINSMEAWNIK